MKRILYILAIALSILACTDEIDKSNRFTFTGETMADYLLNRSDRYSHFINLLKRAGLFSLLNTYGQYTLFLPDNAAVEKFVSEQDSIYWATKDTDIPVWTGITSPLVEELSDSMVNFIARMHLIEKNYRMADFCEGTIGKWNFNDRALVISYKVTGEQFYMMINNSSAIVDADNEVENGFVHHIDKPIDIKHTTIVNRINEQSFFKIISRAIAETGFTNAVLGDIDYTYKLPEDAETKGFLKTRKYIKYTAFLEPDDVFYKNGIYTLDDLIAFAERWYGTEDRGNLRSPKNALYKFVAYHFIDGEIAYNKIVPSRAVRYFGEVCRPEYDLYNYFTTLYGKLIKVMKPLSTPDGQNIYINYSKRTMPYNFEMRKHLNVRVIQLTEFTKMNEEYADFNPMAANGIIHPIDKILVYDDDEMTANILNERMRFDAVTLLPELSSNNIWQNESYKFPGEYCKGIKRYGTERYLFYLCPFYRYHCDCLLLINRFDWAIKLPPVPSRVYEIRINLELHSQEPDSRKNNDGGIQIYLDDVICDLPLNTELAAKDERVGWIADDETYDNGVENDKLLRNKGWMKGPDNFCYNNGSSILPARNYPTFMRKIITRKYLADGEHWLRFRNLTEDTYGIENNYDVSYYMLDYIEIVPFRIVSDPTKPEDRH